MAVDLWRCPYHCALILVGPQIADAEQHLETCDKKENPDV